MSVLVILATEAGEFIVVGLVDDFHNFLLFFVLYGLISTGINSVSVEEEFRKTEVSVSLLGAFPGVDVCIPDASPDIQDEECVRDRLQIMENHAFLLVLQYIDSSVIG